MHSRRIFRDVDLFLAPSEFLRQRYVACGVDPQKIAYARYGMRPIPPAVRSADARPISFGYIGALHAHKGVELLVEAFRGLEGRAALHIHGSAFGSPISRNYGRRLLGAGPPSVTFHGSYDNDDVGTILSSLDVVVVPPEVPEVALFADSRG